MVILSIMTAIAFSYKDFKEIQKKNWLLEDHGITTLARKLMNDVITDNIVTTFEDLKELHNPLRDSFVAYKPSEVKKYTKSDEELSPNPEDYDFQAKVHEKPRVIPDFVNTPNPKDGRLYSN